MNLKSCLTVLFLFLFTLPGYSNFHVIVGSSKNPTTSQKIKNNFRQLGYKNSLVIKSNDYKPNYRVSVSSFKSKKSAQQLTDKLRQSGICKDAWIFYLNSNAIKSYNTKKIRLESNIKALFRNIADGSGIQFDYIDNYTEGSLQDLLYNKLKDIPSYILVVDESVVRKGRYKLCSFYILSKEDVSKSKEVIKIQAQKIGADIWNKIQSNKMKIGSLKRLSPQSVKEYFWQDLKFIGYRYQFQY